MLVPLGDLVDDVEAFCAREGIACVPSEQRVGHIERVLGNLA